MTPTRGMMDPIRDFWIAINTPLEGIATCMYADTEGNVTTGMGNLLTLDAALKLPWVNGSGAPATPAEITADFNFVLNNPSLMTGGLPAAMNSTTLRLTEADLTPIILAAYDSDLQLVTSHYPMMPILPQGVRFAIMSMAWAMGPDFPTFYPHFSAAVESGDWETAAAQCIMNDNPPPTARNNLNVSAILSAQELPLALKPPES